MKYVCTACGRTHDEADLRWACDCGGLLDLEAPAPFSRDDVDAGEAGPWRYVRALPDVPSERRVTLGEARTPLARTRLDGADVWVKLDFLFPTGSYKDRGTAVLVSKLEALGVTYVIDDSSGNAGASLAAYAAAAGMRCAIYTPAANSPGKLAQIRGYGADLRPIHGDRAAVMDAALRELGPSAFYASHNRHPLFLAGVTTLGFELWEQLDRRAPRNVVVPTGYGALVLGVWRAFAALRASGAVGALPRIFAVQARAYSALAEAWDAGASDATPVARGQTIAEGVACPRPLRAPALLAALRESGGAALAVDEEEIVAALRLAGSLGYYIEPTSAVAVAGLRRLLASGVIGPRDETVLVLTGSGLKTDWPVSLAG